MRNLLTIQFMAAVLALLASTGAARAEDSHDLFEDRCGRCHGHAGSFVAEAVVLHDGQAVTKTDAAPLADFLRNHRRRLTANDVSTLTEHMTRIAERDGLFRSKCGTCHETARYVARDKLMLSDGRIIGRYSGRDMTDFLRDHGRATAEELDILLSMLREQLDALNR